MAFIPCQCCGKEYTLSWSWFICDKCGYRICMPCLAKHKGKYGNGYKCSQCMTGWLKGPKSSG
jgi:hypothetical protein